MSKKKCDICRTEEKKEEPFMPIYRMTTTEYAPKKDALVQKIVYRTKQVFVCPNCFLVKIENRKLKKPKKE